MNVTEMKPLKPLDHGNVLIVGTKASNFDEEMRTHPRVIMWDSQNEHWTSKDIPTNVQAIFITKWIGHAAFKNILAEARRKRITIFNPQGTGIIARQVRELLATPVPKVFTEPVKTHTFTVKLPETLSELTTMETKVSNYTGKGGVAPKLTAFLPFVDWSKTNAENARICMTHAEELGVTTTLDSLSNFLGVQRKKLAPQSAPKTPIVRAAIKAAVKQPATVDVSVQILDEMIKGLQDMRAFLVATVEENQTLRNKLHMFRKMVVED
jgi:hypothetical protein